MQLVQKCGDVLKKFDIYYSNFQVDIINRQAGVFSPNVGVNRRRLLGAQIAIRTLELWRLSALVFQVSSQRRRALVALLAIWTGGY